MNAAVSLYRYTLASSSFQYDYYLNSAFQYSYRGELSYTSTVITTVNLEETTTEGGPWTAYTGGTPIQTFTYSLNEPTLTLDTNDFIRQ
ncbi:MAG: hypothetical protein JW969_02460 [Spirochaetales bacterium]|nr:hypothetical protein [Spirochaetales bacterium]